MLFAPTVLYYSVRAECHFIETIEPNQLAALNQGTVPVSYVRYQRLRKEVF